MAVPRNAGEALDSPHGTGLLAAVGVLVLVGPYNLIIFGRKVNQVLRQWQQPGHAPPSRYTSVVLVFVGILAACLGFRQVINSLVVDLLPSDPRDLAEIIFHKRGLDNEPTLVVVGEARTGHPLARLKHQTEKITAIVTVADDGGSSGGIRSELGIPHSGDIRNTLVAMANTEPLMEELFQYRFDWGEGLQGHSFGNLFIAAMTRSAETSRKPSEPLAKC